jgi:hypothetical protein
MVHREKKNVITGEVWVFFYDFYLLLLWQSHGKLSHFYCKLLTEKKIQHIFLLMKILLFERLTYDITTITIKIIM